MFIRDDLKRSIEFLSDKDDTVNKVMKKEALKEIERLSKQIDYLHAYLKEIAKVLKYTTIRNEIPHWHEIIKKVDKND